MKLCFSTLGCTEKNLDEILVLCRKYDIPFLEIRGIDGELDNRMITDFSEENMEITREKMKKACVKPLILGTSCSFHDKDNYEKAVAEGKAAVLTAEKLGAKGIRVFGNNLGSDPTESTRRVISGVKTLCDFAFGKGVDILLEVHGDFNTAEALSPVAVALKNENNFGLIWDICHTQAPYGENWLEFYEKMRPFIRHVHIKDLKNGVLLLPGDGEIPIKPIVSKMLSDGYEGVFSLEWEKKWHPELPEFEKAMQKFLKVMILE